MRSWLSSKAGYSTPADTWFTIHREPLGNDRDIEALVAADVGFRLIRAKRRIECASLGREGSAWRLRQPRTVESGRE
jgi:hypothetical protein